MATRHESYRWHQSAIQNMALLLGTETVSKRKRDFMYLARVVRDDAITFARHPLQPISSGIRSRLAV